MLSSLYSHLLSRAVFSASEEQKLLHDFFEANSVGVFLDIGANEPNSAVSLGLFGRGWKGLVVDPIPANASNLEAAGFEVWCGAVTTKEMAEKGVTNFHVAGGESGRKSSLDADLIDPLLETTEIVVPVKTLAEIIESQKFDHIDLLSVDVEGSEMDVLSTLPQGFPVKLLLVEDWARDTELHRFLLGKGFRRIRRTGYNSWYVPKGSSFAVSPLGQLHLIAKLNWFAPIRKRRFDKKKAAANKLDG